MPRLAIIVGHEAKAKGATAVAPLSMSEYDYNTLVAEDMEAYAKEVGLTTQIFFRDNVGIDGVGQAASAWASESNLSRCIELHFNAATPEAKGTETLYDTREPGNKRFAETIQKFMVDLFRSSDRGTKVVDIGRGSSNLKAVTVVGCLVEPLFGSNSKDAAKLLTQRVDYAKCLVSAVIADINKEVATRPL
jgi:N-acetylmuramoyl-L-alanine amidase